MEEEVTVYRTNPLAQLIYLITGIISILLALRFGFLLLGLANVPIVTFVYQVTDVLVRPFYGLLGHDFVSGSSRLELESLIALLVVGLVGGILGSLFRSFR